jgi:hypothetical protein
LDSWGEAHGFYTFIAYLLASFSKLCHLASQDNKIEIKLHKASWLLWEGGGGQVLFGIKESTVKAFNFESPQA